MVTVRSFSCFVLLLSFVMATAMAKAQHWTVKELSGGTDSVRASYGACTVTVQKDNAIRMDAHEQLIGYSFEVYHDLKYRPSGGSLIQEYAFWISMSDAEQARLDRTPKSARPDIFWETCGEALRSLRPDVLDKFRGWNGLPLSTTASTTKTKKEGK